MIASHPRCRFQGSYVALPTPFRSGALDLNALEALIDFHLRSTTDGLVVCGTTGEAATLSTDERQAVIAAAVARAKGRLPVIAGVGTNCTRTTIDHARAAAEAGADGLLVVTPYYNRPGQRGLAAHFDAVAQAVSAPIVLYNVPSRTGIDLEPATVAGIALRCEHVVAVKEAKADLERVRRLVGETPVAVLCGEDSAIADFVSLGAVGVIGVVANVLPREVAELVRCAAPGGDGRRAADLLERVGPLARALFLEPNPVPVKAALARLFPQLSEEVRLPLVPLEPATRERLAAALLHCGLA